jgi:hypothetical protein
MSLRPSLRPLALALGLAFAGPAILTPRPGQAFTLEEFQFSSPAEEQAFRNLTGKLRCLVCQNESLAGSQADLAQDLREEVYRMMQSGQSEQQIIDFLVERYGDGVGRIAFTGVIVEACRDWRSTRYACSTSKNGKAVAILWWTDSKAVD